MNNETVLSYGDERGRNNDEGRVPAWDKLVDVPFLGTIGRKIDEAYAKHEVKREDYDGGGSVIFGRKINESGNLDVETELQEEIRIERYKKIGRMVLDLPVIRRILVQDRSWSIYSRNRERVWARESLDNKR